MFVFTRYFVGVTVIVMFGLGAANAASPPVTRPSIEVRTRSASAASPAYTITDVGMPPSQIYVSSAPIGFNNTGQIYGMADRKAKDDPTVGHVDASCLIWTGAKYVDLTPSLMVKACTTYSMNSADATAGSYTVVGSFQDIHHDETDAFASHVDSAGNAKLVPYYDHFPAALYGVNSKGTAIGYSFSPFGYTYKIEPIFVTKPPELLTLLQPDCAMAANSCLEPLQIAKRTCSIASRRPSVRSEAAR